MRNNSPNYCYTVSMATTKTTAKQSQNKTVSTTTPKVTLTAVMAHLTTSRKANLAKSVKPHYTDNGAKTLAKAIVRACAIPTMASEGITTDKSRLEASARREFATKRKATLVNVSDILGENKGGEITHSRPENTVRVRLASIAKAMGLAPDTFYAVRATEYRKGEVPQVFIVRK